LLPEPSGIADLLPLPGPHNARHDHNVVRPQIDEIAEFFRFLVRANREYATGSRYAFEAL
jgi:hypothetical protein